MGSFAPAIVPAAIAWSARSRPMPGSPPTQSGRAPRRAEALKFLIHFVGDVHQPLHAIDNHDHGGNDIKLRLGRRRTSLHHYWDTLVVEALGDDSAAVADGIAAQMTPQVMRAWQSGTPADWANQSWAAARTGIYGHQGDQEQLARAQLAKAGVRLAWLLNMMFR